MSNQHKKKNNDNNDQLIITKNNDNNSDSDSKNNNILNLIKKSSSKNNKNVSILLLNNVNELLDIHIEYVNKLIIFKEKYHCALRFPNFPECISENIIKEYINIVEKRNCISSKTSGDLQVINGTNNIKIEVKCFTSIGPTSFGPTEKWNEIYFLDGINFLNKQFTIYKLNLSNDSIKFKSIKINSNKTYEQVCKEGKRPRISFKLLQEQLYDDFQMIYKGSLIFI